MEKMTGAELLIETLIEEGVNTVFGYPGGTVLDIYDALYDRRDRIRHIETTHEQHATHAADGYARATGRCGVVIATSGPGATNLVTGIATAYLDSIPLVAITGNVSNQMIGTDAFQELDITGVTLPITKHNYFVRSADRLEHIVHEAFALANSGRKGPVLVDIPSDVQHQLVEPLEHDEVKLRPQQMVPDSADLEAAARAINSAERPFIYFGGGVVADGAGDEVVELAKRISAPIGCSLMGVSGIPTRTPNFLGMQGMHGHFASTKALNASDCLIALGVRFNDRATGDRTKFGPSGKVVRIDIDSSELSKTLDDKVELLGDVEGTLRALLPLIEPNTHEAWGRKVRELRAEEKGYDDYRDGMTPKNLMIAIDRIRPHESAVVTDVGQHQMWAAQYLTFVHPREFITSGGLGTMGFGFGAAIGAALGTGCRSVLITGDGSFAMNMAETITAADHDIPVTVVLLNNGTLGMVRQMQSLFRHQRYSETTLSHKGAGFCAIARGMGAKATRTETLEDFSRAFEASFSEVGPVLIECPIGIDEFVTPVLQIGASMDELIVNMDDVKQRMGR